jgi:chitodextrinase
MTTAMAGTLVEFPFTNFNIDKAWGTTLRIRVSAIGFNGALGFNESGATYPYNSTASGVMSITGVYSNGAAQTAWYTYFYKWKISAGSTCSRTPVFAVINSAGCTGDTQIPTTPGTITFGTITQNSIIANWTASTDNVGVTGYEVWVNNALNSTVTGTTITLTGLTCNTTYSVKIRAKDAAGNYSAYNTAASASTIGTATPVISSNSPICAGGTVNLSIPTTTGATYEWIATGYTATTAAITRTSATTAMAGTYSVTRTINGCKSTATSTTFVINAIPVAPTVTSPENYQLNATATPLSAIGSNLQWYSVATLGTATTLAPTPATTIIGTTPYYVSQIVSACESPRSILNVIVTNSVITQSIVLSAGWNLISINVLPTNTTIASVFGTTLTNVDEIKNSDGFYKVGQVAQLQSLTDIALGKGYLVKMKTASTLVISGTVPGTVNVSLKNGWNMVGYPVGTTQATTTKLSGIWTQFQTIKNFDGFLDKTSGTLNTMTPGDGYFINVTAPCTITY